ncbi:hypothetical protein ASPTUDRAFT_757130 [Aspergillus tubingensis CBS 134.48]|uniref:LPXTG-motif cell wall anchor domain protein n=1 Tax=Aspergillus tubingensis (strain CBS 134.48) TaxID=767770 RepID=A0A1L9MYT2_ASPTC|nr:hypothetical protein ASPTUDRAFT_757130 [Aspergillus tubingensis CBS 134.48]
MPDRVVQLQMSPDAAGAGNAASPPPLPSYSSYSSSSSSFSSSPADHRFNSRRRRKTESAVHPPIHVSLEDPSASLCRRSIVNRARTITFSAGATSETNPNLTGSSSPQRASRPDASPRTPPESQRSQTRARGLTPSLRSSAVATMMLRADDPRDAGKAAALTSPSAGASDSPSAPTTTTPSASFASPSPSASTPVASHLPSSSSSSSVPPVPRLPQSRFSFEYQYPLRKRALTSHLSAAASVLNGDDTPPGPDPSPTPQRTFLYDSPRRSVPNFHMSHLRDQALLNSQPPSPRRALEKDSDAARPLDANSTVRVLSPNATKRRKSSLYAEQSISDVKSVMPSSTVTYSQGRLLADERNRAMNGLDRQGDGNRTPVADDFRSKNEDVFLNIARSDSDRRESLGRSELRRSRFRMSGSALRSPTSRVAEQTPSPEQLRLNTYDNPLHSQNDPPSTPHTSVPSYSYSASAHPLDEHSRSSSLAYASGSRSTIGLPRSRLGRTSPEPSPYSPESHLERRGSLHESRAYRHSALSTIRSSRQPSSSEATERARFEPDRSRQDGTESTLSTNAPSTVWDELEDLKSRIKKLELTGKLPPSSQEAISSASGDRPRTATTTVTTVSSSPKRGRKSSIATGDLDQNAAPSPVHPLLQSALTKSKEVLGNEVYAALEVTVTDALALSTLLSSNKAPSGGVSIVNGYLPSDRQARRKADSVCRSLTELCLALSDDQLRRQPSTALEVKADEQQINGHDDDDTITPTPPFRRSTIQEPESLSRRQSNSRVTSRLEARRASMANNAASDNQNNKGPDQGPDAKLTQSPGSSAPVRRLSRLSTSLRTKRVHTDDDNAPDQSPQPRSIQRSMTDITNPAATYRVSPRQRISHGYTASQSIADSSPERNVRYSTPSQPSQLPQPRTPTLSQSAIPLRRSILTPGYVPATSRSNIQAGSRRYGLSPGIGSAALGGEMPTEDAMSTTPRQEPSQTRIIAPSQKLAASYTPIAQNRLRANSLGARRFGLRQRPMAVSDEAVNGLDQRVD